MRALAIALLLSCFSAAQTQKGSAEGRVIDAVSGDLLPGITVRLTAGDTVRSATSDANGRFRFDDIQSPNATLGIEVTSGYIAHPIRVGFGTEGKATGVDLMVYKPASVRGRVYDSEGRPAPRVKVSVLSDTRAFGLRSAAESISSYSIALGYWGYNGLVPGRYTLVVAQPAVRIRALGTNNESGQSKSAPADSTTFYPSSTSLDKAEWFTVEAGQIVEVKDIRIARQDTVCVQSRVLDPEGVGRIGLRLEGEYVRRGSIPAASGVVEPGAAFEVCGLSPGDYRLQASSGNRHAARLFSVGTAGFRLPDMHLEPLISLAGRFSVDPTGSVPPKSLATVYFQTISPAAPTERIISKQLMPEGAFTIPAAFIRDQYSLTVWPPAGFYVKSAMMAGRDVLREPLVPGTGELDIVLGPDAAALTVDLFDREGRPARGIPVMLGRDPLPSDALDISPNDLIVRSTDYRGRMVLSGIAPGKYRLLADEHVWQGSAYIRNFFLAHRAEGQEIVIRPYDNQMVQVTLK